MMLLATVCLALLAAVPTADPTITLDHDQLNATIGDTLTLESTVTGSPQAIAHLNVASLDGTYVDLEDWTSTVTQPVPEADAQLSWEFQAVNAGHFTVYVVLIPTTGPLIVSRPVRVTVTPRSTLDTGGAVPVVLVIPALLGAATLAGRLRNRR